MSAPESHRRAALTTDAKADSVHELDPVTYEKQEIGLVPEQYRTREDLEKALNETKNSEAQLRKIIGTIPTLAPCNLPDGSNEFLNHDGVTTRASPPREAHGWGWKVTIHLEDLGQPSSSEPYDAEIS